MGPHNSVQGLHCLHSISTNLGATQIRNEAVTAGILPSGRHISGEIGLWHTPPWPPVCDLLWHTQPYPPSMVHTLGCHDIPRCMPATYRGKPGPNDRGLLQGLTRGHLGMPHPVVSTGMHHRTSQPLAKTTLDEASVCITVQPGHLFALPSGL